MAILTAILTHLDAPTAGRQLEDLRALAPQSRVVVCHGGAREDYERLETADKLFIDDPSLRRPSREQSYMGVLRALYEQRVRDDTGIDLLYLIEYDHLILRGDYEELLRSLADRTGAGLIGKSAGRRNDTNWPHFTRYRRDATLNEFFLRVSRRDDPDARFGSLGSGMLIRRDALEALATVDGVPHAYLELLIPTLVFHLGFDVADVDAYGDLYASVRWRPEFSVDEAIAVQRAGAAFVHPFKDFASLPRVRAAR